MTSQSESTVRAGEQRYRHLFKHMPVCIVIADVTATPAIILEANRRAELVYGYTAAEFAGMPAAYLIPEDARPAVLAIVQRVQQGQTVTAETTNQRRDCTCFPVRIVAAPDPTDARHMIVTVEDITAEVQRRSEAEAIDAERHRIAHEIHDGVAQSLAGLRFKSALWHHLADAAPPGMRSALEELQTVLSAAIVDLRPRHLCAASGGSRRVRLLPGADATGARLWRSKPTCRPAGDSWPAGSVARGR